MQQEKPDWKWSAWGCETIFSYKVDTSASRSSQKRGLGDVPQSS